MNVEGIGYLAFIDDFQLSPAFNNSVSDSLEAFYLSQFPLLELTIKHTSTARQK